MPAKLSRLPITKVSATGNDFLLVDLFNKANANIWKKEWAKKARKALVKLWCHRQEGLGADGLVFIERDKVHDFAWDFYNSDGSSAEMCGNAARAVSLYFSLKHSKKSELKFSTKVGAIVAKIKSANNIEVRLPKVAENQWNQILQWKGSAMNFDFVRAGVPHAVVRVPNLEDRGHLRDFALEVKRQPSFLKEGTNVTFVRLLSQDKIESITFERGVEDFTLSCGTGAVASAHSVLRGEEDQAVEVQVPGGRLTVVWKEGYPLLRGPARIVAEMYLCR
jgi:diaminopimelate epimerase